MLIRHANYEDAPALFEIGQMCYLFLEALSQKEYEERLKTYPNHFWIMEENGEIVSFINGLVSDEDHIEDEMVENPFLHHPNGQWQAILGVNTVNAHQGRGIASMLLRQMIADIEKQDRKGCVLACKKELILFYEKFGSSLFLFISK